MSNVIIFFGKNLPKLPRSLDYLNKNTLDFNIPALRASKIKNITLVAGKPFQEIKKKKYTNVFLIKNKLWNTYNNLYSLYISLEKNMSSSIFLYGDVLINTITFKKFLHETNADFIIGYDSHWQRRYISRNIDSLKKIELVTIEKNTLIKVQKGGSILDDTSGEFSGIFYASKNGIKIIKDLLDKLTTNNFKFKKLTILDLIDELIKKYTIKAIDISGNWSEMDSINDIKSFIFKGKADTLKMLEKKLKSATILPQITFTSKEWNLSQKKLIDKIQTSNWKTLAIRSSSSLEDGYNTTLAGKFKSVLNVNNDILDVKKSVNEVVMSMNKTEYDKVLIQPYLSNSSINGVAFSVDLKNGSPYFVINFDENNFTDGVTSGKSKSQKILYISRLTKSHKNLPKHFLRIRNLIIELEKITGSIIDIEFSIKDDEIYLFQVRPLILKKANNLFLNKKIKDEIIKIKRSISKYSKKSKSISGEMNLFSDMTDWNPAEIIGIYPKPLSISLYKYLITDATWIKARKKLGYKNLIDKKLMLIFGGHPYINIRSSLNSFLPKKLPKSISDKLINFYLNKLNNHQYLHDKIEFALVYSCYTPKLNSDLNELKKNNFSTEEINIIKNKLKNLTKNFFLNKKISIEFNLEQIEILDEKFLEIKDKNDVKDLKIILDNCIKFGTLPFSILARYAFIASKILNDLCDLKLIKSDNLKKFFSSIQTVASEGSEMYNAVLDGKHSLDDFLKKYGHLRPGTYDLLQYRYDQKPELYFSRNLKSTNFKKINKSKISPIDSFSSSELNAIDEFCKSISKNFTANDFLLFSVKAIESREFAKFKFSKTLSYFLELLKKWGSDKKIKANDLVYLDIKKILQSKNKVLTNPKLLNNFIDTQKLNYKIYKQLKLPSFINGKSNIDFFTMSYQKPNFITNKIVTKKGLFIKNSNNSLDIDNSIILIENADPGFDWLFTYKIKGLITKYGGVASHMAIRCQEFNLPAAIGCGDLIFENVIDKKYVTIDCENELIFGH